MKFSKIKKEYFIFSRKERNASIVLIVIIAGAIAFPPVENLFASKIETKDYSSLYHYFDAVQKTQQDLTGNEDEKMNGDFDQSTFYRPEKKSIERELFYFDPNKISADEWMRLGVQEPVAKRIINYRNHGGVFREKSDLLKTYGFTAEDFNALEKYILLDTLMIRDESADKKNTAITGERKIINLNTAGADDLMELGFNKVIASRIVNFIQGVGGIYAAEQLKSVYGINEAQLNEIMPFLQIDPAQIHLINLNSATEEELSKHSYISDELAHEIIEYKKAYGRFVSVSEIMKVKGMYPALFDKLKPYLII